MRSVSVFVFIRIKVVLIIIFIDRSALLLFSFRCRTRVRSYRLSSLFNHRHCYQLFFQFNKPTPVVLMQFLLHSPSRQDLRKNNASFFNVAKATEQKLLLLSPA